MGWGDLSRDQRQYVQQINDQLMVIERRAWQEALALIPQLDARVHDPQDWLTDYEIELDVSFSLREDDPAYQDGEDTILVTLNEWLSHLKRYRDHPDGAGGVGSS